MKNIIVGTAGHIDHGKSALVRALSGVDPDRLAEEKRRGISIDLGFAHLDLPGARVGFVDVPGHERFVKNMLAGAGGIDAVLLVIAADESIKPQTREHFDICRLLGIPTGLIVLTKADLVDAETLELARLEAAEFAAASFLANAPILAVSSTTGAGLEELRQALLALALATPPRDTAGPPRLPIDRSFSLRGFGTVVTGTLLSGTLHAGDDVQVYPSTRRFRIRGLQVHNGPVPSAEAGQRTAVNLAGVEASSLARGCVLAPAGLFSPTRVFDCRLRLLPSAPPLKHRAPIHLHAATATVEAQVRLLRGAEPVLPGAEAFVRIHLAEPLLLLPGDRFIARMFSPVVTIAGGVVLDNNPPLRLRKAALLERLPVLDQAPLETRLLLWAGESQDGVAAASLSARAGIAPAALALAATRAGLLPLRTDPPRFITPTLLAAAETRLRDALAAFHLAHPLLPGMPKANAPGPAFITDSLLASSSLFATDGELLRLAAHRPNLHADEDAAALRIEALFRDAALSVPSVAEVLAQSGLDPARSRTLLELSLRRGALVRVSADLIFHRDALAHLHSLLAARKGQSFSVPDFKLWTGVSRKYAIPLLEFLDRTRITRRAADRRVIV